MMRNIKYKHRCNHLTRGTGPPTFEDEGTKGFWCPLNFVTSRVVIKLNFTANSLNSWITHGVICVSCVYSEV